MSGENHNRAYFYIAIALIIVNAVTLGLSFLPNIGVYMLITSVTEELCALAFLSAQKKRYNFKGVFIATLVTYILLAASLILFVGGLVYVAVR